MFYGLLRELFCSLHICFKLDHILMLLSLQKMDWIMSVPSPSTTEENWGSKRLLRLVEQLKIQKSPRMDEENNEKIGTNCGIRNYMTNKNDEEFGCVNWRERRAAVLICLFEGSQGELRVILTKRSMNLASHPGNINVINSIPT